VEGALLRASKLIESTVTSHRRQTAQRSVLTQGVEPTAFGDVVEQLISRAQRSIGAVLTEDEGQPEAVCAALERLGDERRRGLAVRLLCTPRALGADVVRALGRHGPLPEIRVAVGPVQGTLIVDGRMALVPVEGQPAGGRGSAVQDPAVVRAIESLFAGVWSSALSPDEYNRLGSRARTSFTRRILHHLSAGLTDDMAAREMGVSLRTYRRHVAEIMRALGANSRFQAGARAVELGLMSGTD
jgi:DNA-binding CsgD family transcriptional regulator